MSSNHDHRQPGVYDIGMPSAEFRRALAANGPVNVKMGLGMALEAKTGRAAHRNPDAQVDKAVVQRRRAANKRARQARRVSR